MSKHHTNHIIYPLPKTFLLGLLVLIISYNVVAGPVPMPLEAQLDMAKRVFIGKIIQIKKNDSQISQIQWGRARVEVKETLKGEKSDYAEFNVATGFNDPNYSRKAASPPRVYGVGRSGIWLIGTNNVVLHSFGLLDEDRKSDVQRILKNLEERKWSEPVCGLRAWASVVKYGPYKNPVIIFAVQNVSDSNIYVPFESLYGFIKATVISDRDESHSYGLGVSSKDSDTVFCRSLSAGQIAYLHPQYSYIELAKYQNLPIGKYSVTIGCCNIREGVTKGTTPASKVQIQAWKGQLQAESVELVIK